MASRSRNVPLEADELLALAGLRPGFVSGFEAGRRAAAKDGASGHYNRRNRGTDPSTSVARRVGSSPSMLRRVRDALEVHAPVSDLTRIRRQLLDD